MAEQQITDRNELAFVQTGCVAVSVKGSASHPSLPGISYEGKDASLTIGKRKNVRLRIK